MTYAMYQPPQPRKRGFLRTAGLGCLGLLGFVFVIGIIGAIAMEGDTGSTTAPEQGGTSTEAKGKSADEKQPEEQVEKLPGIGDPAKDGDFTFVVTKVEKGPAKIGNEFVNERAQGVFWFVRLKVTNHGDEPGLFSDGDQKVLAGGKEYGADTEAAILLDDNEVWLEEINPGNTASGTLVYDLPKGVTPEKIELHDSMFSGGVEVSLQ